MQNKEFSDKLIDIKSDPVEIEDGETTSNIVAKDKLNDTTRIKTISPNELLENTNLDIFGEKNE